MRHKFFSLLQVLSIVFLIYIMISIKFSSRSVAFHKYDTYIEYEAFYSDPLHILNSQYYTSTTSENDAIEGACNKFDMAMLLWVAIGATVYIVSAKLKK